MLKGYNNNIAFYKMSGNRFQCGMRRFDKHKVANDKPTNVTMHNEQQQKLSELLRLREAQDKGVFVPIQSAPIVSIAPTVSPSSTIMYTPWKTPSSTF
jgi:hypothetical protein